MKSIFLLWHLIISMATLKGGDGDGGGSDSDSSSDDSGGWGTSDDGWGGGYQGPSPDAGDYDSGGWDSFGNDDGYGGDSNDDTGFFDSIVDTVSGWFADDDIEVSQTVTEDATYTASYDPNTGTVTTATMDNLTGAYDVTVTTPDMFGGFQVDNYSTNPDGSMNTSHHTSNAGTAYSYSYDQHYYTDTNMQFGTMAEMYADLSELLGYEYSENVAKGIETVTSIAGIAFLATGFQTSMGIAGFGQAIGSKTLTGIGYVSAFAHGYGIFSEMENLAGLYGGTSSYAFGVSSYGIGSDGNQNRIQNIINASSEELKEEYEAQRQFYTDIATGGIFDKMAGGRLYQSVFAGDIYYDATKAPNTNFSVGDSFSLSSHSLMTNAPYAEFLPKNQAGTDTFNVSNLSI